MSSARRILFYATVTLGLSVIFFAPRFWLMQHYVAGSFQWDRAHTFLLQCEDPFRRDIEPAMLWRVLPPLVAHTLHLPGLTPLALPWLGILAAIAYVAVVLRRTMDDWRFILGGTLLFSTTSAVLVPVGWLGMNDAWVWLGLLAVAFGRAPWTAPIACLLCPWIDERFIIGLPLAWLCHGFAADKEWRWSSLVVFLWVTPYAALRLWLGQRDAASLTVTHAFLAQALRQVVVLVPFVPLGWWMGLRAAWFAVGYACWSQSGIKRYAALVVFAGTATIPVLLAADLSRSIAILVPAVVLGCVTLAKRSPAIAPRATLVLAIVNLLIPAAHVTYTKIDPINPLPIELYRLLRPA